MAFAIGFAKKLRKLPTYRELAPIWGEIVAHRIWLNLKGFSGLRESASETRYFILSTHQSNHQDDARLVAWDAFAVFISIAGFTHDIWRRQLHFFGKLFAMPIGLTSEWSDPGLLEGKWRAKRDGYGHWEHRIKLPQIGSGG